MSNNLEKTSRQWLKARDIIATAITDMKNYSLWKSSNDMATAIIARLAKEGLLIVEAEELKE